MSLMWFAAGVVVPTAFLLIKRWERSKPGRLSWGSWLSFGSTLAVLLFAALWVVSSLIENEGRAALMGAVIFGGITVLLAVVSRLMAVRDLETTPEKTGKTA